MSTVPPLPPLLLVLVVLELVVEPDPPLLLLLVVLLLLELLPHAASATIEAATAQPVITFPTKRIVLLWFDPDSRTARQAPNLMRAADRSNRGWAVTTRFAHA
jgi:hypothetical protein